MNRTQEGRVVFRCSLLVTLGTLSLLATADSAPQPPRPGLAVPPRFTQRPLVCAHRGRLNEGQAENSVAVMQRTWAAGVPMVEFDLRTHPRWPLGPARRPHRRRPLSLLRRLRLRHRHRSHGRRRLDGPLDVYQIPCAHLRDFIFAKVGIGEADRSLPSRQQPFFPHPTPWKEIHHAAKRSRPCRRTP